ncbi:MAG TPA: hypothetical protein VNH11_17240 [Pirellulales bacterium]|nr:hypothetical protein [Pirellulales bacterium]
MFLELESAEQQLLIELVAARLHELERAGGGSTSQTAEGLDGPRQIEVLEHILHHLHEAEFDVTC